MQIERDVNTIMKQEKVQFIDVDNCVMRPITRLSEIRASYPEGASWAKRIINTSTSAFFNSATLVSQNRGEGFRRHFHPDCDEFWIIMAGSYRFEIEGHEPIVANQGDILYARKGSSHTATVVSDEPGIRFSISVELMETVYV